MIQPPSLRVSAALRGAGSSQGQLSLKQVWLTNSWGAQPASARLIYVPETVVEEPVRLHGVAINAYLELNYAGATFHGVCRSDTALYTSQGNERVIEFEDLRTYLSWDYVFGAWNLVEVSVALNPATGRPARRKRFRHLLPWNYERGIWTWTERPYTAAEIVNFILGLRVAGGAWTIPPAPTVGMSWNRVYHPDQVAYPLYNVDARDGKRLDALLTEITQRQGLVFTSDRYLELRWCRKGELLPGETVAPGALDAAGNYVFPADTNDCRIGVALSQQPTRVLVVGSENVYQVLNLPLQPDWASGWDYFMGDTERFVDYIYRNWTDPDSGLAFTAFPNDPDHLIGYFTARALAQRLTLRDFAAHEDTLTPPTGEPFRDYRKFAGRARMDMPCMLYMDTVVFRAFRPPPTIPLWGQQVPTASLRLVDGMLTSLNHDEVTGRMTADLTAPLEGNGYATVQGYQVMGDLFDGIRADRFKVDRWTAMQELWKKMTFSVDDSGDGTQFVLFDAPLIRSEDLVETQDGYAVFRADATLTTPPVLASLTFLAERFIWRSQNDASTLDFTINEPELRREVVYDLATGDWVEIPYADGQSVQEKAHELGTLALTRQFTVMAGGFRRWLQAGSVPTRLSGFYDRVTLFYGPPGHYEDVDFANERDRAAFEPERDYDRDLVDRAQFPGQAQLRARMEQDELLAAGLRQSKAFYESLTMAFRRFIGFKDPVAPVQVANPSGTLRVGTPLWRAPMPVDGGSNTRAVMPAVSSSATPIFCGVVTREAEPAQQNLYVQATGHLLARVKGPVAARDTVAQAPGQDYLVAKAAAADGAPEVGMALQTIPDTSVRLISVQTGGVGGGGKVVARWA